MIRQTEGLLFGPPHIPDTVVLLTNFFFAFVETLASSQVNLNCQNFVTAPCLVVGGD